MIIEVTPKNQTHFTNTSNQFYNTNPSKQPHQRNTLSSKSRRTIEIRIPIGKTSRRESTRYNTLSEGMEPSITSSVNFDDIRTSSSTFKSVFQPKRTCGNMKYFLEVVHKRARAKTIQDSFQHYNHSLYTDLTTKQGFKGKKLSFHSPFSHNKTIDNPENFILSPKAKFSIPRPMNDKNTLCQDRFFEVQQTLRERKTPVRVNNNLNIYRKKLKCNRDTKLLKEIQENGLIISARPNMKQFFSREKFRYETN